MAEYSFDIVSKVEQQEVDNALSQARKELDTRYDFKGTNSSINEKSSGVYEIISQTQDRALAAKDVVIEKCIKRSIDRKAVQFNDPVSRGKQFVIGMSLKEGIDSESAKKITKCIKEANIKGIRTQIIGDEIRVFHKSKDSLQEAMHCVKQSPLDLALQFKNFR